MSQNHQSRVFTFIGNRTNQLKNTCAKGLRQLKVAVVWGGQILFYPLHLLAQTKIFQPQFSAPASTPVLPQPAPDIDIEQALDLVEVVKYPIQIVGRAELTIDDYSDPAIASYPIQVAEPSALVVDDWSYIDENLWDTSQGNTSIKSQEITYRPSTSSKITQPKPIIRGLSSLLSDRQLVLVTTENELLNILTIAQQQEIRRKIGLDLAISWHEWYLHNLALRHSPNALSSADQLLLTQGNSTVTESEQDLPTETFFDKLRNWFIKPQPKPQSTQIDLSELIPETAISPIQPQIAPASFPFSPQSPKFQRYLDLPQLPPIIEPNISNESSDNFTAIVANIAIKIQPNWLKNWWNYYREYISISNDSENALVHQPAEFKLTPIAPTPSRAQVKQQPQLEQTASIYFKPKSTRNVEYHPDWIEAEAEEMGYSKSLVASILAWLDRQIFRLENWIINILSGIFDRDKHE